MVRGEEGKGWRERWGFCVSGRMAGLACGWWLERGAFNTFLFCATTTNYGDGKRLWLISLLYLLCMIYAGKLG